jgi:uncharacterized protein (TIGR02271 family)
MDDRQNLHRYSDMSDVEVAPENPDVRGWYLQSGERKLGKVDDLIVDRGEMKVRYLEVDLDRSVFNLDDDRHVLLPIERVQLDESAQRVLLSGLALEQVATLPTFDAYASEDRTGYAGGGYGATGADQRITRSEEELRVGKRREQTGEVRVGKHVETEHVREPVTRQREQVNVERRPVEGEARHDARFGENEEIRVPVVEEEIVVDKRPVVKEELVVSKETITDRDTVEADVRRERFDVEKEGRDTRTGDRAAERTSIARGKRGGK